MANFLRDTFIRNRAFKESTVESIYRVFEEAAHGLIPIVDPQGTQEERVSFSVVIRFDQRGYRVWNVGDLMRYFREAKSVERLSFEIDTTTSFRTGRSTGAHCTLQVDVNEANRCLVQVASDDRSWVEKVYADLSALVDQNKTVSALVRTPATLWLIQIAGVSLGILLCIWLARLASPALKVDNPFLIAFLVALLIFSNTWTFLLQFINWVVGKAFPNVMLLRKDEERLHWAWQAVVGVAIAAAVAKVLAATYDLIEVALRGLLR